MNETINKSKCTDLTWTFLFKIQNINERTNQGSANICFFVICHLPALYLYTINSWIQCN